MIDLQVWLTTRPERTKRDGIAALMATAVFLAVCVIFLVIAWFKT